MNPKSVAVVILCHDQYSNLCRILRALSSQSRKPFEVTIVDDGSMDPVEALAAAHHCRFVSTGRDAARDQWGSRALARELGAASCRSDLLIHLDGDMIPSPRLVETIMDFSYGFPAESLLKIERRYELDDGRLTRLPAQPRGETCMSFQEFRSDSFAVRRDVSSSIGGWDSNFRGWGEEDIEFAYRFHLGRIPISAVDHPEVYATHIKHQVDYRANFLSLQRNASYFVSKHPEITTMRAHAWRSMGVYLAEYGLWKVLRKWGWRSAGIHSFSGESRNSWPGDRDGVDSPACGNSVNTRIGTWHQGQI
jgi:GT2 family glycosyltransferase